MKLSLPQQTYQSRSKPFGSERLLNMVMEPSAIEGEYMLIGTPGLKEYYTFESTGNQPILGMIYLRDCLVYVNYDGIYVAVKRAVGDGFTVDIVFSKTWSALGIRAKDWPTSPVQMATNGNSVVLLNQENGMLFYVELTGDNRYSSASWSIGQCVTTTANITYSSVCCMASVYFATCQIGRDTYVQFTDVLAHEFKYSFQLDTALSNLSAIASNMRELWVFGANSIEILAPTGELGDYFVSHVEGAYINKGCVCKNSVATYESIFYFYGTDNSVYASSGYGVQEISTPAILDMINSWGGVDYDDRSSVVGQVFVYRGHPFYMLKFKNLGKTLMYDILSGAWIERESGAAEDWEGHYIARRPTGEIIVSSKDKPILYSMDNEFYTDNGVPIRREFVFGTITQEAKKRMFFKTLTIEIDSGLGPDDKLILSWSDDGGYTWGKERMLGLGKVGQYNKKIQFRRLGSSITRIFRVRLTTASMINVLRADIDFDIGQA